MRGQRTKRNLETGVAQRRLAAATESLGTVILSEAKNLLFIRGEDKQVLRFAQHDRPVGGGSAALRHPWRTVLSWTLFCLVAFSLLFVEGCRLDMHIEPRYDPMSPSTFFPDGRSERPMVPGTVARGQLRTDELLYTGRINGQAADVFPFPITKADLVRGQQRFDIYCTPCHDYAGSGEGMIVRRGFPAPPSYLTTKLMNAPVGHFFDVMTNGYGTMFSYADRVSVKDRWRIAAYIRVLQLSRTATLDDVPTSERLKLLADKGQ